MSGYLVGSGLLCLDVVYPPEQVTPFLFAGGSSLNAAAILSDWGWNAALVGRIGNDRAAQYLLRDLDSFQLDTSGILLDASINTPIYSQTFAENGHRFQRKCLQCGAPSPMVQPLDPEAMQKQIEKLPHSIQVAIIERDDLASVLLAKACKERGALVYVELNRMSNEEQCVELISHAHIYKYARDRCGLLPAQDATPRVALEIETQGKDGLRYRISDREWRHAPPLTGVCFTDAAGSGDWVSATLIDQIARRGAETIEDELLRIDAILAQAQAEAAENGKYIGARGRLYQARPIIQANNSCPVCGERIQRKMV